MHLFVYGTLLSDFDNQFACYLRDNSQLLGLAEMTGHLFDCGNYPGFIYDENGYAVRGELFEVLDDSVIAFLDAYEDIPNLFIKNCYTIEHNQVQVEVSVYEVNMNSVSIRSEILSGDYRKHLSLR